MFYLNKVWWTEVGGIWEGTLTSAALLRQQPAAVLVEALLGEYSD